MLARVSLVRSAARCALRTSVPATGMALTRRCQSTAAADKAQLEDIVSKISKLTLIETADLISLLKERLNISEVAMPVAAAAAPAAAAAAAPSAAEEKPAEKTIFNIKLEKFDAANKAKVIKEIKALMPNMGLIEAKKFVEAAPKMIKEDVTKDEAEKIKKALEAAGATIVLE